MFLKISGTEYMPELDDKILLLESLEGTVARMKTEKCIPTIETLVKRIVEKDLPIVVTRDIGHGTDSKGIIIGQEIYLKLT